MPFQNQEVKCQGHKAVLRPEMCCKW